MGFSSSSGNTSITGNVTAVSGRTGTLTFASNATGAANNTQTVLTVAAGRKYTILSISLNGEISGAFGATEIVKVNAEIALKGYIAGLAGQYMKSYQAHTFSLNCAPILAAGQTVTVETNNANTLTFCSVAFLDEAA